MGAEEIAQFHSTVRAIEDVLLINPHHRQLAALFARRVSLTGGFLLFDEQLLASNKPPPYAVARAGVCTTGRTSTVPRRADGIRAAIAFASSRSLASIK